MQVYTIKQALKLPGYKITVLISESDSEVHLRLEPDKCNEFICSGCGKTHKVGYHGLVVAVVEDLPIFGKRAYLHVVKRRYKCPEDDSIYIEKIPWLKKWSRVTRRFAEHVGRLTAITTNQEAGWFFGLDDEAVYRIDKSILEEKFEEKLTPIPAATNISVDEVSYLKYHRYLTNVVDVDRRSVIWNDRGRKTEILDKYYEGIGQNACGRIESVALDGARTYISSTTKHAVNATIVYDKFHIRQKLNWAVDMARKQELRKARKENNHELIDLINCRQRFILLKNKSNLTKNQTDYLNKLCEINQPIYEAMLLKESFLQVYECDQPEEAQKHLESWIKTALSSTVDTFKIIAESFSRKLQFIVNWFKKKISSAISEGINNKIKRLKRMAYGYKDVEYFKLKIHQHCGLLNPRRFPQ